MPSGRRLATAICPRAKLIAKTRAALARDLMRFDERRKQSGLLLVRIDLLFARMAEAEYQALVRVLTERTASPLAPATLSQGARQLGARLQALERALRAGWVDADAARRAGRSLALGAGCLVAGGLIALALRRRLLARYGREPVAEPPGIGRQLLATVAMIAANVVLPGLAVGGSWAAMRSLQPLPDGLAATVGAMLFALFNAVIITGLARSILAPKRPAWRISAFSDAAARSLDRAVRWYALLMLIVVTVLSVLNPPEELMGRFSEELISAFFAVDPKLYAVFGPLALVIIALALLNVLRPRNWRFVGDLGGAPEVDRPPSPLLRSALLLARGGLVGAMALVAFGYLHASVYLVDGVSFSLALASLALLLHTLAAAGLRYLTAPDTAIGRQLRRRLVFDDIGAGHLVFWLMLLLDAVLVLAVTVLLALRWGMPAAEFGRLAGVLARGVDFGSFTLSLGDVVMAVATFLALLTVVRLLQGFLANRVLPQTRLDVGVRDALATGIGYVGLVIAGLVAVSLLGLDLSHLALILGALSVGIGFGLQNVVGNFVAGLILLIQRPIKAGDWIVVGDGKYQGYVKHVNVTATEIQTFDNASVLVPNSNLLANEVLNWTHKSTLGRVILAVGVAYGSDPKQVHDLLLGCAKAHRDVLSRPEPVVLLLGFGPSSLDFELRFYLRDIGAQLQVASELRFAILAALAEAGIAIPFPQHDVHIRTVTPAAAAIADTDL